MALKTGEQYRQSLRERKPMRIFLNGERIEDPVEHPIVKPSINSIALTYELAEQDEHKELMTTQSSLTGETINRFCHLHQSNDDLLRKIEMQRLLGQSCGTCFQRCVGMDGMNSVFSVTYEIDAKHGTDYHGRFVDFVKMVQAEDLVVDGCMTDVKGDRSKRPSEQTDPDMFVRVVERRPDGIVIRGCKAHQTGAINAHYHLLMPTIAMREADKDYAVCCAVPVDHEDITYLYGRQSCDMRKLDQSPAGQIDSGSKFGGQEAMVIFEDVFVPNEFVYMDGEGEFSGTLVERFSGYHRQSYCCKVGVGDVLIGAASVVSEMNGADKASHIKDKIVEMIHLNETIYSSGVAAAMLGKKTDAGNYLIDLMQANVCKHNVTRFPVEIGKLMQDISGGIMATLPSAHELMNPETREYVLKYLQTKEGVAVEDRMRLLRWIENQLMGRGAVAYITESIHGAGSPQAQRVMMTRFADMEGLRNLAKKLIEIDMPKKPDTN